MVRIVRFIDRHLECADGRTRSRPWLRQPSVGASASASTGSRCLRELFRPELEHEVPARGARGRGARG